ncbi:hypothetical protein TNCV_3558001 [Trichonephila clavipes]|uniref:Uncharacterized protein n=1 Tax=Trichonephila clavipes TaxID=2585209 RepID=A0A8X6WCY9_TRICX|nr:hypothetical protein TNCV_3558001 [Trichonephila clavipes]
MTNKFWGDSCELEAFSIHTLSSTTTLTIRKSSLKSGLTMCCIPNEVCFCLGANDGRILITKWPDQRLQTTFLWPRFNGPALRVMEIGE